MPRTNRTFEMHNPPPPGEVLRELYVEPLGWSVEELAGRLGVEPEVAAGLLAGEVVIDPALARRLAAVFGTTVESWLAQQGVWEGWVGRDTVG